MCLNFPTALQGCWYPASFTAKKTKALALSHSELVRELEVSADPELQLGLVLG